MNDFYQTNEQIKSELLYQDHHDFDVLAAALSNDDYAIVHIQAPIPGNNDGFGYNSGQAYIRYGKGHDAVYDSISIDISRQWNDSVTTGPRKREQIPHGELLARWHAPTHGIVDMRVPQRIAAIVRDLLASGQRRYEDAGEVRRLRELERRELDMRYDAERDPEGAFGGRGNNFPI